MYVPANGLVIVVYRANFFAWARAYRVVFYVFPLI